MLLYATFAALIQSSTKSNNFGGRRRKKLRTYATGHKKQKKCQLEENDFYDA